MQKSQRRPYLTKNQSLLLNMLHLFFSHLARKKCPECLQNIFRRKIFQILVKIQIFHFPFSTFPSYWICLSHSRVTMGERPPLEHFENIYFRHMILLYPPLQSSVGIFQSQSFVLSLSVSVFQSQSFSPSLSVSVSQSKSFSLILSVSVFQSQSFSLSLSVSVFQSQSFSLSLSVSVF